MVQPRLTQNLRRWRWLLISWLCCGYTAIWLIQSYSALFPFANAYSTASVNLHIAVHNSAH
ncbi:hypothetical protein BDW67DRAFT_170792 [Aspergillus spinulosporus]